MYLSIFHSITFTFEFFPYHTNLTIFTGRNEVVAKVMFLHMCVILFTGGCLLMGGGVCSRGCLLQGVVCSQGCLLPGVSAPRGVCSSVGCLLPGRGCLLPGGGVYSRPTPKGEIEGDQIQAHTQGRN